MVDEDVAMTSGKVVYRNRLIELIHYAPTTDEKSWRKLDGQNQLPTVIEGIKFTDGIETVHDHAAA